MMFEEFMAIMGNKNIEVVTDFMFFIPLISSFSLILNDYNSFNLILTIISFVTTIFLISYLQTLRQIVVASPEASKNMMKKTFNKKIIELGRLKYPYYKLLGSFSILFIILYIVTFFKNFTSIAINTNLFGTLIAIQIFIPAYIGLRLLFFVKFSKYYKIDKKMFQYLNKKIKDKR